MKDTKSKIFEAAVNLFSTKGFNGTSIRELAREVGIKESSIYNHYPGKKAIFQAILDYQLAGFEDSVSSLDKLEKLSPEINDAVEFWMAGVKAFLSVPKPLTEPISRIIINEMFLNKQCRDFVLNKLYKAQKDLTEHIFRAMYEKDLIAKCDFRKTAVQYVYMIQGLEIENKLLTLEGQSPEVGFNNMIEHMKLFIEKLRR